MEKEHLSQQELITLAETPCKFEVLKIAFLFSCLTGLRKSDIMALTWNKLQPYGDGGMFITVRMQKTQQLIKNPISEEALELIGFMMRILNVSQLTKCLLVSRTT